MKTINSISRLFAMAAVMAIAMLLPDTASAKWSKAASAFSYDGVSVKVTDRHLEIGAPYDTYGYATYRNDNSTTVKVNWKCFGVLKDGRKLVCVEEDSFYLLPKETRNEVYSYDAGKFTHRDFSTYVIAIEVDKKTPNATPETPAANATGVGKINAANEDEIYTRLMKLKEENKLTQDDYSLLIDLGTFMFTNKVESLALRSNAIRRNGTSEEYHQFVADNDEYMSKWRDVLSTIVTAYNDDKLNKENEAKYEEFKDMVQSSPVYSV